MGQGGVGMGQGGVGGPVLWGMSRLPTSLWGSTAGLHYGRGKPLPSLPGQHRSREEKKKNCSSLPGCWLLATACCCLYSAFRNCLFSSVWQSVCGSQTHRESFLWSGSSLHGLSQRPVLQRPRHICFLHSSPPYRKMYAHPWMGAQTGRVEVGVFRERERALGVGSRWVSRFHH